MVRHYKRKREKTYSELTIQKALEDVRSNKMTAYAAAKYHNIPLFNTTIHYLCTLIPFDYKYNFDNKYNIFNMASLILFFLLLYKQ